jgi:hypothetical protein
MAVAPMSDRSAPAAPSPTCAPLPPEAVDRLREAARTLVNSRSLVVRISDMLGSAADAMGGKAFAAASAALGEGWRDRVQDIAERALWQALKVATAGLHRDEERTPWLWFNKLVGSASGAAGGFFGLPGLAVDLPITTTIILRSVAEIARAHGEDPAADETRRACLQVFAFGGAGVAEDEAETGYWSARAALSALATGPMVRQVARIFGVVVSEKVLAQALPIAGAVAGGTLNFIFIDHFQQMARVHFTLRALERQCGDPAAVRACFDALVREARRQRDWKAR